MGKKEYWIVHKELIPKENLSLLEFIESQGYNVEVGKIGSNGVLDTVFHGNTSIVPAHLHHEVTHTIPIVSTVQ